MPRLNHTGIAVQAVIQSAIQAKIRPASQTVPLDRIAVVSGDQAMLVPMRNAAQVAVKMDREPDDQTVKHQHEKIIRRPNTEWAPRVGIDRVIMPPIVMTPGTTFNRTMEANINTSVEAIMQMHTARAINIPRHPVTPGTVTALNMGPSIDLTAMSDMTLAIAAQVTAAQVTAAQVTAAQVTAAQVTAAQVTAALVIATQCMATPIFIVVIIMLINRRRDRAIAPGILSIPHVAITTRTTNMRCRLNT